MREPFRDYHARDRLCRELEQEYGLHIDNGREQRKQEPPPLGEKAALLEAHNGQESFASYAKRQTAHILKALETARDWQALHEALKAVGMEIKPHGNGLVIKDMRGALAVKASSIDRSLSLKKLHSRFGEYRPYRSLRPVQEISRYQAVPLHRSPERGELYARYRQGIEARKARLEAVKERENAALAAIRKQWADKREEIERMGIAKRNRRNLLVLARKHEAEAIAKARLALQPEREDVRREIPFTSWSGFLRLEAGKGNEIALAILRSRKEAVEPELQTPVKDWSQHGMERFSLRAAHAEKERTVLEREDVSTRGKRQLQAFARMERIAEEARAQGRAIGEVKRRIDGRGEILFTLDNGASIRDTLNP